MYNWKKKLNKINFNKFIWFYSKKKKKYINIFGGFPVTGMRKKNVSEKKKRCRQ